jgi:diguanylate cyclase (GGDEF)-like protein
MALKRLIPILVAIAACHANSAPATTPPLTTLHAIHSLSNAEGSRHLPVAFEATVLYFRSYEATLFVGDGNEAIYVHIDTPLQLQPGDRVQVRGNTYADFRPGVMGSGLTFLRHGKMPAAVPATFAAMISAKLDCRYVVVRGTVRSAKIVLSSNVPVTQLELAIPGAYISVTMDNSDPAQLKGWLDSEVEVTGVAAGRFDTKMEQVGILLHATSASNLRVLRPAAQDPWAIRAAPLDQLINNYNVEDHTPQIRVEGTLTYYYPTEMAILQDGNRSIQVLTPQIDPLKIGDRVEAIGIPYVDDGFQTIRLATIRSTGRSAPIAPAALDWNELATGKHAFDLVSIEGTVVVQVREEGQDIYVVSNEGHLFSAVVKRPYGYNWTGSHAPTPLPAIAPGSTVRVTGVAILEDGNPFNGALEFSVLMRSADDVAVVASPPWLNVPHLMFLLGLLLAAMLAVGARGWLIERRMRRQTSGLAYVEQRRSKILESMHASRPLNEILEQITELVSFRLEGAPSWCELCDGTIVGNRPRAASDLLDDVECALTAPEGQVLGKLHAATCLRPADRVHAEQSMAMAAELATLAIETSRLHSDLVHRSEFDLLTDAQNRFSLEKSLDARICAARQTGSTFGLIYIDLDRFKQVNDNYGHHAGDIYLQLASERMKRQLRPGDTLARVGGDEFVVLVPDVRQRATVEDIARRLAGCFGEPFVLERVSIHGSASIGIALYPDDATTRDGLLSAADVAMYAAKHAGRENKAAPAEEREGEAERVLRR